MPPILINPGGLIVAAYQKWTGHVSTRLSCLGSEARLSARWVIKRSEVSSNSRYSSPVADPTRRPPEHKSTPEMAHLDEKTREPREDPVEEDLKGGIVTTAPVEDLDEAAIFLREHNFTQGYLAELLEDSQANKKIVRRIDLTLMPLHEILYSRIWIWGLWRRKSAF
ncbi:hypothetical protein PMZ80_001157 [Knufia obscura]|uniref:Uncharacterized protein n=1 Tax=Knufia obscura TaxID=1635080 RepID=A0ABR0S2G1_9EURO|nr:hypothetical protein PMZ80_001157 [Knufia obscura]